MPEADIAAVDKGYHNLYSVVRKHANGVLEFRTVTKRHYDRRSRRGVMRQKSKLKTTYA